MQFQKISSIELGRVFAISAIISMHCQPFLDYWTLNEIPWFNYIFNQSTRFAVPLFFLISGYLIQPKLETKPLATLKSYALPLLKVYVIWSVICLLIPLKWQVVASSGYLAERQGYWSYLAKTPLNTLLEGGLVHLWFIPALIIAVTIGALLYHFKLQKWFVLIGSVLYIYGVLAGSYQNITGLNAPILTRNGPFFSTLMVALGFYIRRENLRLASMHALGLILLGMFCHFTEAYWLHSHGHLFNANDFLFGTIFWGLGCFYWLLANEHIGNNAVVHYLAPKVFALYLMHLPMILVIKNITELLTITGLPADLLTLVGTILLSLGLIELIERVGLSRYLFR